MATEERLVVAHILRLIQIFVREHTLGYVIDADDHYLKINEPDKLIPDVGFVRRKRMPSSKKLPRLTFDLAIEVIDEDYAEVLREKIEKYLEHGTSLVWIVYPSSKRVDIYRATNKANIESLDETGILSGEDVLPDFNLALKDIFAVLE